MTRAKPATQPELPLYFGRRPDRYTASLNGPAVFASSVHCFTPTDDDVYLLVRCRVGKATFDHTDGGLEMTQTLHALVAYPMDPAAGAERLTQMAIAHEHREERAARSTAKTVAGPLPFSADDDRLEGIGDPDSPHEAWPDEITQSECIRPGCGRLITDPIHHVDDDPDQEPPPNG